MSNPAADLHSLFLQWRTNLEDGRSSIHTSRGLNDDIGLADQRRGMGYLLGTVDGMERLDDQGLPVRVYRKYVAVWTQMLMAYPHSWTNNIGQDEAFPPNAMDHLETLSGWFAVSGPRLREDADGELRSITSQARELLHDDTSLSSELRLYLVRLLAEIDSALDDETIGSSFDFSVAAERLWVALFAASAQSEKPEKKSQWSNLAQHIWAPTAVGLISALPGAVTSLAAGSGS
jgi:hypothetical protein